MALGIYTRPTWQPDRVSLSRIFEHWRNLPKHNYLHRHSSINAGDDRQVVFGYEERDDDLVGYTYGSLTTIDKRLSTITTYVGSQVARQYRINYDYSPTGRSRIQAIQECAYKAGGSAECLPATEFGWLGEGSANEGTTLNMQTTLPGGNGGPALYDMKRFAQADLNGDGRTDLFRMGSPGLTQSGREVEIYWGNETGFSYQSFQMSQVGWRVANNAPTIDFNNDGRTDLTVARLNSQNEMTVHAIAYEQVGNSLVQRVFDTGVAVDGNNPVYGWERPSGGDFSTMTYVVLDIDGDGRHDIVTRDQVGSSSFQFHVYKRNSTGFARVGTPIAATSSSAMFPMDLDGDGQTDLVVEEMGAQTSTGRSKTIRTLYSNGTSFYEKPSGLPVLSSWKTYYESQNYTTYTPDASPKFLDVNGDGLLDVLIPRSTISGFRSSGDLGLYINRGDQFDFRQSVPRPLTPLHFEDLAPHIQTYDYNGDGRTDVLFPAQKTISAPGTCIPLPGGRGGGGRIPLSTGLPGGIESSGSSDSLSGAKLPSGLSADIASNHNEDCNAGAKNDHDGYNWHVYLSNGDTLDLTAVDPAINVTLSGVVITDLDGDSLADVYGDTPPSSSEINSTTGVFPTPRPGSLLCEPGSADRFG